jgi:hypothetical protein
MSNTEPVRLPDVDAGASGVVSSLCRKRRLGAGAIASLTGLTGLASVFLTDNEIGSATLIAVSVYFTVAVINNRFPRLKIGEHEINPDILHETRREADDAKVNSEDAKEGLANALPRIDALERAIAAHSPEAAPRAAAKAPAPPHLDERLVRLAEEYNRVRWTMPSGDARAARMTDIVQRMIAVCQETVVPNLEGLLSSNDRGTRLVGVAYLNARPDPAEIAPLARVALTPDKPFNEYWALLTLRKLLHGHCDRLSATLRQQLQDRLRALPPASDRADAIRSILGDCP